ncbi:MAG: hypothetical protein V3S98_01325 [Dehalococcoidia bacterium]
MLYFYLLLIFIRRFFAVLLIPIFLILFLGTIVTFRVNATLLEPSFYTDRLEESDAFVFLYDEGIPAAFEEAERRDARGQSGGFNLEEDIPLNLGLTPDRVAAYGRRIIPPEWLEENIAVAVNAAVPYFTGDADTFAINIRVDDRVEEAADVAAELIQDADIYGYLIDDIAVPEIDSRREDFLEDLPFISLTTQELVDGMREVVPESWLKEQIDGAIDEITPYMVGKTETFSITIPLQERAALGLVVVERWLLQSIDDGAYEYLLEEQIAPVVQSGLGAAIDLPYGVTVSNEEVVAALGEVLPPEWVADRVEEAIEQIGPYLIGETDTFTLVIPLKDRTEAAAATLVDAADAKFQAVYDSLAVCSLQDLLSLDLTLTELPSCKPPLISYQDLKAAVGLDVLEQLILGIVEPLPDSIEVTPDELFAAIDATGNTVSVDEVRTMLREGYVFTEQDLRKLIVDQSDAGTLETFDDIRGYLRDGFDFNDGQIRERLSDDDFQSFDDGRGWVDRGRSLLFVLIILLLLLAAIIGFLGGRSWGTRLTWAGVPALTAGFVTVVLFGGIGRLVRAVDANSLGVGQSITSRIFSSEDEAKYGVLITKLTEVNDALVSSFVNPIVFQAAVVALLGGAMIVGGIVLGRRSRAALAGDWALPPVDDDDADADALVEGDWPSTR